MMVMSVVRRIFRYYCIGMTAGVIGIAAGFLRYIYIMEFFEPFPILMQSVVAFNRGNVMIVR